MRSALLLLCTLSGVVAFSVPSSQKLSAASSKTSNEVNEGKTTMTSIRRAFISQSASSIMGLVFLCPSDAFASGGATAGKYTTIPIAKRRYYGRVQQAVHEFLAMGPAVLEGNMNAPIIQEFFNVDAVVVVPAKRKDINGQCTKKDGECKGNEIRDSRWNDMKASMYLLGNAFRINQQKAPANLPTVKAAYAFFKEMDAMEKCVKTKSSKKFDKVAIGHYAAALEILDNYLDLVELPPTNSGHYDQEFDTLVGVSARIM